MRKLVAAFAGLVIAGISATSVSAAADHTVQKGDSLWNIANNNNTTVEALMDINNLNSTMIYPDQVLKVEGNEQTNYYIVQQGDTLSSISSDQGVTVSDLKAWNNLSSDLIYTGEQLAVNGEAATTEPQVVEQHTETAAKAEPTEETETAEVNTQKTEAEAAPKQEKPASNQAEGQTLTVESTAYTAGCAGCSGVTATGVDLNANPDAKVIAVDPNVIPLGTEVYVEDYGYAVAADTGGAIKGNKIDVHVPSKDQAYSWGRRTVEVTIVD
ncbi:LysM peptidoglycan-binding domain-containing protein [Virgibacillus xinjiangensis]|uniref:LysM peptidoglycan-binding domain-containing protein n=1 Tax=Virgibacillus xinjiangensis TaxID=393090 RepID=A0ABV7CVZ5_9BACI